MESSHWLAERFEEHRSRLRSVAYRMLGSLTEADDAVQDAWERASRAGVDDVENLGGWLTTIIAPSVSTCCGPATPGTRTPSRPSYLIPSSVPMPRSNPRKRPSWRTQSVSPSRS